MLARIPAMFASTLFAGKLIAGSFVPVIVVAVIVVLVLGVAALFRKRLFSFMGTSKSDKQDASGEEEKAPVLEEAVDSEK